MDLSTLPKELPLEFLKEITDDFSTERILGRSVFGTVYKGILPEGSIIAVKKLAENSPVPPGKLFGAEVSNLLAIQHENIVPLVAFCNELKNKVVQHNGRYVIVEIQESLLCYKYMPKGTLDRHIFDGAFGWEARFQIIKGICNGLHFLHNMPDGPLIHMNLFPTSVWLDENWVPKIADFCLSRLFGQEKTRTNTMNVMGQCGYMAPEYLYRGEISTMSDIYSLGMLILETTTGEKNGSDKDDKSARKFIDRVHQDWKTVDQIESKYPSLPDYGLQAVKMCILIGLKCVAADRNKRPSIMDIVNKFKGDRVAIFDSV